MPQVPQAPRDIQRLGLESRGLSDLYHQLLTITWMRLMLLVIAGYVAVNLVFAALYLAVGGGIENAREGSFSDLFFFSVQTMATIGYGKLVPVSFAANAIASVEALMGLLGFALITGLIFSKFARPTAAVQFSNKLVLSAFEGKPALMFRMANERTSQIVEAQLRFVMLKSTLTAEGNYVRRLLDVPLMRSHNAFFSLTWLAVHLIDERSPLHGMTFEELSASDVNFAASLTGIEEISGQTVHSRRWYVAGDVLMDTRFVDIIGLTASGGPSIDYSKFQLVEPSPGKLGNPLGSLPSGPTKLVGHLEAAAR